MKLDVKKIWKEVQANRKRLDECEAPHVFKKKEKEDDSPRSLRSIFVCEKCNGEIGASEYSWYTKGLEHGKK